MFKSDSALFLPSLDVVSWAFDDDDVFNDHPVRFSDFIS
jgi:hypothetical protein